MVKEEAIIGFASGAVYGLTSLIVGYVLVEYSGCL
jgi:hypothetical protein